MDSRVDTSETNGSGEGLNSMMLARNCRAHSDAGHARRWAMRAAAVVTCPGGRRRQQRVCRGEFDERCRRSERRYAGNPAGGSKPWYYWVADDTDDLSLFR